MHLDDFRHFAVLLRDRLGIEVGVEKLYLVESRLKPIAAEAGVRDVAELLAQLRRGAGGKLLAQVLDAMTTNETFFFRDGTPFDQLRLLLPELVEARRGAPLRIWCAACSTGQEPYSIAMLLDEEAGRFAGLRSEIVATDVSPRVLEKAKAGVYSAFEVQRGLNAQRLARHFDPDPGGYRIKPALKRDISWRPGNLLGGFAELGLFDVIFCRNVLIYFARETRATVLERLADRLREGGRLFLGAAETPLGLTERLVAGAQGAAGGFRIAPPARSGDPATLRRGVGG
jgi:chemotaxis protein methyltransferase CheR